MWPPSRTAVVDELRRYLPEAATVHCDDFFAASVAMSDWQQISVPERAARCIDWRRLRSEALYPLSQRRRASWRPFDFSSPSGLAAETVTVEPASIVLVDGIYSGRPELADLMTLTVLVDAPVELRQARHDAREGATSRCGIRRGPQPRSTTSRTSVRRRRSIWS